MKEITEAEKLLLQVANMSCGDLPLSTQENHKNIWAAFYAGIAWHEVAQQGVQLTALRHWLVVSIFINVILLAVALYAIGGN